VYALLIFLVVVFLKKYHAGEVGVSTGSLLFGVVLLLLILSDVMMGQSFVEMAGLATLDARQTIAAIGVFKFVILDLPTALLVFLGWSVGESYARERWGERLASFDALLRRDVLNATVGRSLLRGALAAPAVAAVAFLVAFIPLLLKSAHPDLGGSEAVLFLAGPMLVDVFALTDAMVFPIVAVLFLLALAHRKRVSWLGGLAAVVVGTVGGAALPPIEPQLQCLLFGWGAIAGCILVFSAWDLLSAAVALGGAAIIVYAAPLLSVAHGSLLAQLSIATITPVVVIVVFAVAALMTGREVVYSYEDLAPHVKRIVERERVKAEIDAANRIQAALLPIDAPRLAGASFASHYRAATEIGGDYFDFLMLGNGEIGLAFGDVSGHGLTSGIVMAMAKAALLVQVGVDPSPRVVMNVLNDVVIKTAPKRIMMTFFFGILDPDTQQLRFSSAGHLDPYVYRGDSGRLESLSSWGFPLGVRRRDPFREHVARLAPGDRLILYSDGLIEAVDDDGDPFGFERFEQVLRDHGAKSAEEIKKTLLNSVRKFTRNRPPEDDQTLVVVSFEEEVAGEAIA
ncbi:MAG TPA: PP2C family protein-serine/threonine phosphatase, partial [Thermoanaerobaculia bacterium]|nr:PP2C family protein-serine/threonine phosphatase [Thermoanaerobaculia bacterium]